MGNSKRRESVMTFSGEEDLIVPKKGGYGQPDNENFLMIEGKATGASIVADTPSIPDNVAPVIATPPVIPTPPIVVTPIEDTYSPVPYKDYQNMDCEELKKYLGQLESFVSQPIPDLPRLLVEVNAVKEKANSVCRTKQDPIPSFPDFSKLSCKDLDAFIKETQPIVATSTFSNVSIAEAYNEALKTAKNLYTAKCPVVTIQGGDGGVIITPIGQGGLGFPPRGGGGGGVGGGGEDTTTTEPIATGKNNFWWILLVIGGVILLTRKKN